MKERDIAAKLKGHGLTTAKILYYRPDAPSLLQVFAWQECDVAPDFPALPGFLDDWRREIEAQLHSVRLAHDRLIRSTQWRPVSDILPLP
ncbi:protein usg [Novosphingobium resinovorum]|uniref:protein usg n=1 Tax=Novosphingobium resinovorum TaxID=158500 RepID=UPI002ED62BF6|nr:protein usg [Novosphingobium resinovorum]